MAGHDVLIGVDAGGTATKCMAAIGPATTLVEAGPGNFLGIGRSGFAALLRNLQKELKQRAGIDPKSAAAVCVGGAGLGRQHEQHAAEAIVRKLFPRARIAITDDASLFLWAAFGAKPGIVLLAGTGSICLGRAKDGRMARAGGWGPYFGDPGSAFALGRRAIAHALAVRDCIEKPSPLAQEVTRHFGVLDALSVLSTVGAGGPGVIASLAPLVLRAAARNERVAQRIVAEETAALAAFIRGVIAQLGVRLPMVACGGGLFGNTYYVEAASRAITAAAGAVRVSVPDVRPVEGAVLLARAQVTDAAH